jgi:hypothetical protein
MRYRAIGLVFIVALFCFMPVASALACDPCADACHAAVSKSTPLHPTDRGQMAVCETSSATELPAPALARVTAFVSDFAEADAPLCIPLRV